MSAIDGVAAIINEFLHYLTEVGACSRFRVCIQPIMIERLDTYSAVTQIDIRYLVPSHETNRCYSLHNDIMSVPQHLTQSRVY